VSAASSSSKKTLTQGRFGSRRSLPRIILAAKPDQAIARRKQDETDNGNHGNRFVVRMSNVIGNVEMLGTDIARHLGIVETPMLQGQAMIDQPIFMQVPVGN
jgi:hypothetical protein